VTPGDLLRAHLCSAHCMTAASDGAQCRCVCRGRFHSLLNVADVQTLVDARMFGPREAVAMPDPTIDLESEQVA
jgi:hypothetical protein